MTGRWTGTSPCGIGSSGDHREGGYSKPEAWRFGNKLHITGNSHSDSLRLLTRIGIMSSTFDRMTSQSFQRPGLE